MDYQLLSKAWNADPNAPEVNISVTGNQVTLRFYLNCFLFDAFNEGDTAILRFNGCHKYTLNSMNDEGYFMGKYRYKHDQLPWGEFYQLETDWEVDFPRTNTILTTEIYPERLKHYIFFFKDNCFECVTENYEVEFLTT
ncbi:MAG: hypothetical protein JST68_01205 [Bacteroidetes bacterium]|nr:hypothetical protein [Bacteroidota bacterium]